jgi:hypothetical protein
VLRAPRAQLHAVACAALLAGCATTQMNSEWRDPAVGAGALKGTRVLVICRGPDEALRRVCEDQWTSQLGGRGAAVTPSYSIVGFPWSSADGSEELRAAVRASGASAVATMSLQQGDVAVVNPGAQVGIGIGGGSGGGYRSGGFSYGGIGITLPIGGASMTQGLNASSSVANVASGKLVWSGSASTPASADIPAQVSALTSITIEAIRKAGLI